ncbi:MAG TPA: xanthine dehydrogenase family protein subunit M [Micropepsaceae bacterium]|nr:xanthine dehydrogenase family protein subunit M [Micropepsaceae bacterium]
MYPASFRYWRASTVHEAEQMFNSASDPRYVAGGQSLIPAMKQRLANPSDLIDLSRISGLSFIRRDGERLVIGAGTRHADVAASAEAQRAIPALAHLAGLIGDPAVRHRGTLGGSIANNDPAADYPAAVLALDAVVTTNRRNIPAGAFFTGMFETALQEGEIVTEVTFPLAARAAYMKFPNPASRYAMPGVFVAEHGKSVRVAVTGAAACVYRAAELESALSGQFRPQSMTDVTIRADEFTSDLFASAEYRANLVKVMAQRAVGSMLSSRNG